MKTFDNFYSEMSARMATNIRIRGNLDSLTFRHDIKQESIWGTKNFALACSYRLDSLVTVPNADHFDRNNLKYFIMMLAYKIKSE